MKAPVRHLTSWLTSLPERFLQRMRRMLVLSGIFALALMMVVPAIAAAEAADAGASDHRCAAFPWEGTALGTSAWTNSTVMLAPLYLRIPEPQLLNNTLRGEIFSYVQQNPGATFSEVRASVAGATGTVQHHLRVLVRGGVLRRVRTGKYTRYYPYNHRVLALPPSQERLVEALAREGPGTKAELAQRTGMSRQLVHYHVERMAAVGLVEVDRRGDAPRVRLGVPVEPHF